MVLHYLNLPVSYNRLVRLLRIGPAGAPFRNLQYLEPIGLSVHIQQGEIADLRSYLQQNSPLIVFVNTGQLPYWIEVTGHAVVVVGIEADEIRLNDPAFNAAPKTVSIADFMLAWLDMDQFYAVITLK